MDEEAKISLVKMMTGEKDEGVIKAFLALAGHKICRVAYPYDESVTTVPDKYAGTHVDAAVYLLNKRGAEGETVHLENGISRHYESADLPVSMLRSIAPMVGVPQ